MMKQKLLFGIVAACLLFSGLGEVRLAKACAGYTITVGSTGTLQQELLTQILSLLISQRTGTNIQMARFDSQAELLAAAKRHDIDLLVVAGGTTDAVADLSKQGLVLLAPFGCDNARLVPAFQAATLKRFPALKRLVSKLGGLIDDDTFKRLAEEVNTGSNPRAVAKKFLAEQKLIFGG